MASDNESDYADLRAAIYSLPADQMAITQGLFGSLEEAGLISKRAEHTLTSSLIGPIVTAIAQLEAEVRRIQHKTGS